MSDKDRQADQIHNNRRRIHVKIQVLLQDNLLIYWKYPNKSFFLHLLDNIMHLQSDKNLFQKV